MKLLVNGEIKDLQLKANSMTLIHVIRELGHDPRLVVVEFNGTILTPKRWESETVKEGDVLEIVTIVGGGS